MTLGQLLALAAAGMLVWVGIYALVLLFGAPFWVCMMLGLLIGYCTGILFSAGTKR